MHQVWKHEDRKNPQLFQLQDGPAFIRKFLRFLFHRRLLPHLLAEFDLRKYILIDRADFFGNRDHF